jgi:hypothetical protein
MQLHMEVPSRHLTEEDAVEIWIIHVEKRAFQSRIAAQFDVNQGRISEILTGKKFPGARAKALRRLGVNDNNPGAQGALF